jgi:predicted metal-binding membrane protein
VDRLQKIIFISLISTSAIAWLVSGFQQDSMAMPAMTVSSSGSLDATSISLFTAIWTAGMAAMMFPAISPMVLLYNRLIGSKGSQHAATVLEGRSYTRSYPLKTVLFVGCYLVVWAATGIALLVSWTALLGNAVMPSQQPANMNIVYGAILIISGAYQFSPLKSKCLGYCESPMSFFMRRWKDGTSGAVEMGLYHGVYCLGCCWPYFLLMVALGWMNLLWMGLFAAIIFGEKIWNKGIWVARAAGVGLALAGVFVLAGYDAALVRM